MLLRTTDGAMRLFAVSSVYSEILVTMRSYSRSSRLAAQFRHDGMLALGRAPA